MDFGSDGLEREVKTLKKQLNQKDIQVQSIQNENWKLQQEVEGIKKARDEALYKLQQEAEKSVKNETALAKTSKELANLKIQLANADRAINDASALAATSSRANKQAELRWEVDGTDLASLKADRSRLEIKVRQLEAQIGGITEELKDAKSEARIAQQQSGAGSMFGSGAEPSRRGNEKARVIDLENQLMVFKAQNKKLEEQSRDAASHSAASSSSKGFFGESPPRQQRARPTSTSYAAAAASPVRSSSNARRRSSSLTSTSAIQALESQVASLEHALTAATDELEPLKGKLANSQRLVLRLENEAMALERNVKREMEALQSRLEETEEERDELRASLRDASGAGAELDKTRRAAAQDRERLEEDLRERAETVKRLEARCFEVEDQLEQEREAVRTSEDRFKALSAERKKLASDLEAATSNSSASAPAPPPPPPYPAAVDKGKHDEIVADFESKIALLEGQLASAGSAAIPALPRSTSDKAMNIKPDGEAEVAVKRLEKELKRLKRDKQTLEDDLAASDEAVAEKDREILSLRNNVPLPSSPPPVQTANLGTEDVAPLHALIAQSESDAASARSAADQLRSELTTRQAVIDDLEQEIQDSLQREEAIKTELRTVRTEFEIYKGEMDAFASQRNAFEADLAAARQARESSDSEATRLASEVTRLAADASRLETESAASSKKQEAALGSVSADRSRLETVVGELQAKLTMVAESEARSAELELELKQLVQHKAEDVEAVARLNREVAEVKADLDKARGDCQRLEDALEIEEEQRAKSDGEAKIREDRLVENNSSLAADLALLRSEVESVTLQLAESQQAAQEAGSRVSQLDELCNMHLDSCATAEAEVSRLETLLQDRSTASEAEDRDHQLLVSRQEIQDLRSEMAQIKKHAAEAEDDHRQAESALRASAEQNEKVLLSQQLGLAEQLERTESDLLIASTELQSKENEVAALVEAARSANEAAASAAAASAEVDQPSAGPVASFSVTQLELEGIQRLQEAVARLRVERDGLRSEQDELRLSLSFSDAETKSTLAALEESRVALTDAGLKLGHAQADLTKALDEVDGLLSVSEEATSAAERAREDADSLQAQLDAQDTSRVDLVRQLQQSEERLATVQQEHSSAQEAVSAVSAELVAAKAEIETGATQLQALNKHKDELESKLAYLESVASSTGVPVDEVVGKLRYDLTKATERADRKADQVSKQQHEITRLNANAKMFDDGMVEWEADLEKKEAERAALQLKLDGSVAAQEGLTKQLQAAQEAIVVLEGTISKAQTDHNDLVAVHEAQVTALNTVVAEEQNKSTTLSESLADAEAKQTEVIATVTALTFREAELLLQIEAQAAQFDEQTTSLAAKADEISTLAIRVSEVTAQLTATKSELELKTSELATQHRIALEQTSLLADRDAGLASAIASADSLRTEFSSRTEIIQKLEAELTDLEGQLAEGQIEVEQKQTELVAAQREISELNGRTAAGSSAEESLVKDKDALESTLRAREDELAKSQSECARLAKDAAEKDDALEKATAEVASLESLRGHLTEAEGHVVRLTSEVGDLQALVQEKETTLTDLRQRVEQLGSAQQDQSASHEAIQGEHNRLLARLSDVQTELEATITSKEELATSLTESQDKQTALRSEIEVHSATHQTLQACLDGLQATHDALVASDASARDTASQTDRARAELIETQARELAGLRTEVDSLTSQLASTIETRDSLVEARSAIDSELVSVRAALDEKVGLLGASIDEASAKLDELETLRAHLTESESELSEVKRVVQGLRAEIDEKRALEGELEKATTTVQSLEKTVKEKDAAMKDVANQAQSNASELVVLRGQLQAAEMALAHAEARHTQELETVRSAAATPPAQETQADGTVGEEQDRPETDKEKCDRLVAELTQKTNDVEESDDKLIHALKETKKLKKKIDTLQKKVDKFEASKAAVVPPVPTVVAPPPPPPSGAYSSPVTAAIYKRSSGGPSIFSSPSASRTTPSTRPIAGTRRVSGERGPSLFSPVSQSAHPATATTSPTFPFTPATTAAPPPSSATKRSRADDPQPPNHMLTAAVLSPVPAEDRTPRRTLLGRRTPGGGGFTPSSKGALRTLPGDKENGAVGAGKPAGDPAELIKKLAALRGGPPGEER